MDEIAKVQNTFYRKLLLLLTNTPGYTLRKELRVDNMELKCFKLVLECTQKILGRCERNDTLEFIAIDENIYQIRFLRSKM